MKLEAERLSSPIEEVTPSRVKATIKRLRSYGPCSFASLTDESGNYVQVAGGRVTCLIERREAASGRHLRAFQSKRSTVFADGTLLVFGAGKIALQADEWFTAADAEEVFLAFLEKRDLPQWIKWRDVTRTLEELPPA